jgi:hypothetical protein
MSSNSVSVVCGVFCPVHTYQSCKLRVAHVAWLSAFRNLHKASSCSSLQAPTLDTPPSVTPASATAPARRYLAGLHDHGSATKKLDCVCKPRAERSGIFGASEKCGASMSEHELIPPPRVCASTITTGTQSRRRGTYDTVRDGASQIINICVYPCQPKFSNPVATIYGLCGMWIRNRLRGPEMLTQNAEKG